MQNIVLSFLNKKAFIRRTVGTDIHFLLISTISQSWWISSPPHCNRPPDSMHAVCNSHAAGHHFELTTVYSPSLTCTVAFEIHLFHSKLYWFTMQL